MVRLATIPELCLCKMHPLLSRHTVLAACDLTASHPAMDAQGLPRLLRDADYILQRLNVYSAYNPRIIQKLLDIYRVYYNYVAVGEDKRTPAMRLGLAMGPVKLETILYFDPLEKLLPDERPKPRRRAAPTGSVARPRKTALKRIAAE